MSPIHSTYLKRDCKGRCTQKVHYMSRASAAAAFVRFQKKNSPIFDFKLRVYRCPYADHYHLGHVGRALMFIRLPAIARSV